MKNFLKYHYLYYLEIYHRFLFDEVLLHSDKRGEAPLDDAELILLWLFKKTQSKNWRKDIKHSQKLLSRAYNQRRLSPVYFSIHLKLNKRNYVRYAG